MSEASGTRALGQGNLWMALEGSIVDLELALLRFGQGVGTVGVLIAGWAALTASADIGVRLGLISLVWLGFYTVAYRQVGLGRNVRFYRYVVPALEATMPAVMFWVLSVTESPEYALGSWVPPELFTLFIAASILRLQPRIPLIMGFVAALSYFTVYFFLIRQHVTGDLLLYSLNMQVVRVVSLLLTGLTGFLAVRGLKRAIAAANENLRASELFGKYKLGKEIASGGMGKVVKALYCPEGGFQRVVAVKIIHPHLATDSHFIGQFRSEAELSARLVHPNIVASLDFGRVGDTYFLAMEYVDGPTLQDILKKRRTEEQPLDPMVVAYVGEQLCRALAHGHSEARDEHGELLVVIHRDLSPANVLVRTSGQVLVSDYGVARALRGTGAMQTRNLVGKPSYMAPEQLKQHPIDVRTDLWSLGVILWEMLCNRRLFLARNEAATLLSVLEGEIVPPSTIVPGVPPALDEVVMGLLERDPAQRTVDAPTALRALRSVLADQPVGAPDVARVVADFESDELELELDGG